MIVSVQNYLDYKCGVRKFILKSYCGDDIIISRKNIKQKYCVNGEKVDSVDKFLSGEWAELHSVLDSSLFGGLIDTFVSFDVKTRYYCHHLIEEEIEVLDSRDKIHLLKKNGQEELFSKCDETVFFNLDHYNRICRKFPSIASRFSVMYHWVPKKEIRWKRRDDLLLYVGRITEEKGIFDLISWFKCQKGYTLRIIGNVSSSRIIDDVRERLLGLSYELIDWIEEEEELDRHYQEATYVVLPSRYDTHPIVGVEAIANGAKLIVSDKSVFDEIFGKNIKMMKS